MELKTTHNTGGIGFVGLLTIAFIVLKLTGHIDWAWMWVLSPLWISAGIVLGILAILGIIIGIAAIMERLS